MRFIRYLISIMVFASAVYAVPNPAAIYCEGSGYEYKTENGKGFCLLPDDSLYDAWNFYYGIVGSEYGYCESRGLESTIVESNDCIFTNSCLACILENGSKSEAIVLMDIYKNYEERYEDNIHTKTDNTLLYAAIILSIILILFTFIRKNR